MDNYNIEIPKNIKAKNKICHVYFNGDLISGHDTVTQALDFIDRHHSLKVSHPLEEGTIVKFEYHKNKYKVLASEYAERRDMYCYFVKDMETGEPLSFFEHRIEKVIG